MRNLDGKKQQQLKNRKFSLFLLFKQLHVEDLHMQSQAGNCFLRGKDCMKGTSQFWQYICKAPTSFYCIIVQLPFNRQWSYNYLLWPHPDKKTFTNWTCAFTMTENVERIWQWNNDRWMKRFSQNIDILRSIYEDILTRKFSLNRAVFLMLLWK